MRHRPVDLLVEVGEIGEDGDVVNVLRKEKEVSSTTRLTPSEAREEVLTGRSHDDQNSVQIVDLKTRAFP